MQGGAEGQWGSSDISNAKNNFGTPDSLRYRDDVRNRQVFVFLQAIYSWQAWQFTAGASVNTYKISFQRFAPQTSGVQERRFSNEVAGRLALLRNLGKVSVYASVSKGFSPPSLSELLPTGGAINLLLSPESGISYDAGARGVLGKLRFDVNFFYFSLKNTIVQRRDSAGGDFYLNSGHTSQKGLEAGLQYTLAEKGIWKSTLWASYTHHQFRYRDFKPLSSNFSGNKLPGVVPNVLAAGADLSKGRFSAQATYQYNDAVPLNDANTITGHVAHLLGAQMQYNMVIRRKERLRLFAGADNLLNQRYSLGYDINAFGGRYFNAAPGRNYFAGISLKM